jgi:uncharacterized protein YceH (UPF0502 family)
VEPDAAEIRVVACLVEKQRTTPDQYPLTLNSLRLACNQSTNREPVVDYDEGTVRSAIDRLSRRKWATLASWSTARSVKYKHLLDQALGLGDAELALMTVLMLRGPQTAGELRQRCERIHRFASGEDAEQALEALIERRLVTRLPRRPGERGQRYEHLLAGDAEGDPAPPEPRPAPPESQQPPPEPRPAPAADGLESRVAGLESEVARLRDELGALHDELGALRRELGG